MRLQSLGDSPLHVQHLSVSWGVGVPGHVSHPPAGRRACSHGNSRVHQGEGDLKASWRPRLGLAQLRFCHTLLAKASYKARPDPRGGGNRFHLLTGRTAKSLCKEACIQGGVTVAIFANTIHIDIYY